MLVLSGLERRARKGIEVVLDRVEECLRTLHLGGQVLECPAERGQLPVGRRVVQPDAPIRRAQAELAVGRAERLALAYMKERKAFGKRLDEFQALQFRLADMATALEASRALLWQAAAAFDRNDANATALIAMAKRFVTDSCFDVANQALQLHGGYGYLAEFGVEKIVRDLRVHQILEGTNEIMRLIVARSLVGR